MKSKTLTGLFILTIVLLSFSSYAVMRWWQNKSGSLPVYGSQYADSHHINNFSLLNQNNIKSGTENWNGKIVVVNFFFTHCVGICPKMTDNLKGLQKVYKDDSTVLISSLTVDPGSDSVAQLKSYADRFGIQSKKWQLLTGDKKEIYRLARNDFMILATDGDGGPNDFIHSEKLVLVDEHKRIRGYYNGTDVKEVEQLIKDIQKLKNEN